jgi:hypothetical protein
MIGCSLSVEGLLISFGCITLVQSNLFFFTKEYARGSTIGPKSNVITALFKVIMIDKAEKLANFRTSSPQAIITAQAALAIKLIMPN